MENGIKKLFRAVLFRGILFRSIFSNSIEGNGTREDTHASEFSEDELLVVEETEVAYPPQFKVIIHNDNYTAMDFVVMVLQKHFQKSAAQAKEIMIRVHKQGHGIAGIYVREIAETKIFQATQEAKQNEFPLRLSMELNEN